MPALSEKMLLWIKSVASGSSAWDHKGPTWPDHSLSACLIAGHGHSVQPCLISSVRFDLRARCRESPQVFAGVSHFENPLYPPMLKGEFHAGSAPPFAKGGQGGFFPSNNRMLASSPEFLKCFQRSLHGPVPSPRLNLLNPFPHGSGKRHYVSEGIGEDVL